MAAAGDPAHPVRFEVVALDGIGEVRPGDALADMLLAAYAPHAPADGDILVVTSKIVSKAEGRMLEAADREAAIDAETAREVARVDHSGGSTRIVENRQGLVLAAAGVDASNVEEGHVLLLPEDPDASALALAAALREATGRRIGVIVSDTLGRAWRVGQTDHAIGAAGVRVAADLRGTTDMQGRVLEATIAAVGDELAAAADLVKGKASGRPAALVRGLAHLVGELDEPGARSLQRSAAQDLFHLGAREAWRLGYETALSTAARLERTPRRSAGSGWAAIGPNGDRFLGRAPTPDAWHLVIPVKPAATAKSRLAEAIAPERREALARAIALDTIEAAAMAPWASRVLVVTADAETARAARELPQVEILDDTGDGLDAAIRLGLAAIGTDRHRAVLLGDLPGLAPGELEHALLIATTASRAFVPDADETGTVLATAMAGAVLEPCFGADSAARHRGAGFIQLHLPPRWGLRRDVDEPAHLESLRDRLGPRTLAALDA